MNIDQFHKVILKGGGEVSITRPSTGASFDVLMSSPGTIRDETLMLEAKQSDEQVVFCRLGFEDQVFTSPNRGDRITDVDGTKYSIEQIKRMFGQNRILYGWRCRIRG